MTMSRRTDDLQKRPVKYSAGTKSLARKGQAQARLGHGLADGIPLCFANGASGNDVWAR
jgi:hypothetical protein